MNQTDIDVDRVRADTPGTSHVNHLLACGSALVSQPVLDAVQEFLVLEAQTGGYEAFEIEESRLENVYDSVAKLIGGDRDEIAITENATVAWCQAFYSLEFEPGDRILTCQAEYGANYLAYLHRARRDGVVIEVIPNTPEGQIDVEALEAMIDDRVKLISITWVPTNGGLVNAAAAVGQVARSRGIYYLLDACQSVGQMPVDVKELQCDFLSATGRKFLRAPRGTGFLYVRKDLIETLHPPVIDHYSAAWVATNEYELRSDARRFENWENAYALRAGLGVAAEYAMALGLDAIERRVTSLAGQLRVELSEVRGAQVRDAGTENCAIVSFTVDGVDPSSAVHALRKRGICIGTSSPSSTRLDSEARNLPVLLRAAPHYYNTEDEVSSLVNGLGQLL